MTNRRKTQQHKNTIKKKQETQKNAQHNRKKEHKTHKTQYCCFPHDNTEQRSTHDQNQTLKNSITTTHKQKQLPNAPILTRRLVESKPWPPPCSTRPSGRPRSSGCDFLGPFARDRPDPEASSPGSGPAGREGARGWETKKKKNEKSNHLKK